MRASTPWEREPRHIRRDPRISDVIHKQVDEMMDAYPVPLGTLHASQRRTQHASSLLTKRPEEVKIDPSDRSFDRSADAEADRHVARDERDRGLIGRCERAGNQQRKIIDAPDRNHPPALQRRAGRRC